MKFPEANRVTELYSFNMWGKVWPSQDLMLTRYEQEQFGFSDFVLENEFPALSRLMSTYETQWNSFASWALWMRSTWHVAISVCVLYLIAVYVGQVVMRNRKAFELKGLLFVWNLCLALFSIVGTVRVVPAIVYAFFINGPIYHMCRSGDVSYGFGSLGLWSTLFVLSKYAELVDTLFLILRKKAVPFLHWYHHATVLLLSTGTMMLHGPSGIVMIGMNYLVHSVMYSYYAIAVFQQPKWGKIVTVMQIVQMIAGLLVFVGVVYGAKFVANCEVHSYNALSIGVIYTSYLILFVRFYTNRYQSKEKKVL